MSSGSCFYCGSADKELRPYGPGGSMVCHDCAFATPEREAATKGAFFALLEGASAAGGGVASIGTPEGPNPFRLPDETTEDRAMSRALTGFQRRALRKVADLGAPTADELWLHLRITKPPVSRVLNTLLRRGLIGVDGGVVGDPDARFFVTEDGEAAL
jgi:hypothetical protein